MRAADVDVVKLLQQQAGPATQVVLQLLAATADACQAVLSRAASASAPQALLQALVRLQQLQGKPLALPPGCPASIADTCKVLSLVEAIAAGSGAGGSAAALAAAVPAPAAAPAAAAKPGAAAASGAGAGASQLEQDIASAMSLLAAMPAVNVELWARLAAAAGRRCAWQQAVECAATALAVLPPGKRDAVRLAEVPQLSPREWCWLAVAEMTQGQVCGARALCCLRAVCAAALPPS